MPAKSYGQLCPIARALDVIGDRWTLLLVREFLLGPKRFGELLAELPSMGTNRLSDRLALLVDHAVIEKVPLASAGAGVAYALTAFGEALRRPVLDLALWGMALTSYEQEDLSSARAELVALGLSAAVDPARLENVGAVYELQVGRELFHVRVSDGAMRVRSGPSTTRADVVVQCALPVFLSLALGQVKLAQAVQHGDLRLVSGTRKDLNLMFDALRYRGSRAAVA